MDGYERLRTLSTLLEFLISSSGWLKSICDYLLPHALALSFINRLKLYYELLSDYSLRKKHALFVWILCVHIV